MGLLERIRNAGREAKARYAFIGASVITGAIALVWMSTLPGRFANVGESVEDEAPETAELRELWGETTEQLGEVIRSTGELENLNALNEEGMPGEEAEPSEEAPLEVPAEAEAEREEKDVESQTPRTILIGTTTVSN